MPPQPSPMTPQVAPLAAQVVRAQLDPHWFSVPPPPQVSGAEPVPQFSKPPQPSETNPQLAPRWPQVLGEQDGGTTPETQAERSKIRNSRTRSCAVSGLVLHSSGKMLAPVFV